jgi:hypothetical protein
MGSSPATLLEGIFQQHYHTELADGTEHCRHILSYRKKSQERASPVQASLLFYLLLDFPGDFVLVFVLLTVIWIVFIVIFVFRKNSKVRKLVKKLIECCKRW